MTKRSIIVYWLLLLIPTGLIGAAVFHLLQHEQERIEQQSRLAARDRILTIAESLQLTVSDVQAQLSAALRNIPSRSLEKTLEHWESDNPLIRHAFIWQPDKGLVMPPAESTASIEMRNFVRRYRNLFQGRVDWGQFENRRRHNETPITGTEKRAGAFQDQPSQIGTAYSRDSAASPRQNLVDLAKGQLAESRPQTDAESRLPLKASGWLPWFEENQLFILGWVRDTQIGQAYGVELEMMTLLSRMLALFPSLDDVPDGLAFTLNDGNGRILHQVGAPVVDADKPPAVTVALQPQLPHWHLAAYFSEDRPIGRSGNGFILLSGLLLAIFITAIISGGALLTRQLQRNYKDSLQKTSFVSNVSHELKTPLTSIRMYAELLNEGRVSDPGKKKRYLQIITEESQRLTRLVSNVLDFGRLEQGRKAYRMEPLQPAKVISGLVESQRLRFEKNGVALESRIPETDHTVFADRDALGQVLLNLLDNALKYAAEGKTVSVGLAVDRESCRIVVSDQGPGVPKSHRKKIFEKFHRVDDSLTAIQPGSGLGLSIARKLMRGMGGDLTYEKRAGGGSRFTALLPCKSGDSRQEPHA